MKNTLIRTLPFALTGLLLCTASFAFPDRHAVEQECNDSVRHIKALISEKPDDTCVGDMAIAAAYIETTRLKLSYQKFNQALTDIKYGQSELKQIRTRTWCTNFAKKVEPVINKVAQISNEIKILSRVQD